MQYLSNQDTELCPGAYVWENFLSAEELAPITEELNSYSWGEPYHVYGLKSFLQYKDRLINSINLPEATIKEFDHCNARHEGMGFDPHVDILNWANIIHEEEIPKSSSLATKSSLQARMGFIVYFNDDFEGGEICYPEFDFCYKPKAGDLVVHDIQNVHGVKKVKSGTRYTHAAHISDKFYLSEDSWSKIDWPTGDFDLNDHHYYYTVKHGKSNNKRLDKFMESYTDEYLYS